MPWPGHEVRARHPCHARQGARAGRDPHHPGAARPGRTVPARGPGLLIERYVREPGTGELRSAVAALGITSRTPGRGGTPEALALAARGHWEIEALHHIRDVTMNEDAKRLRAGASAQVTASLRNTAIAALRLAGFTSAAAGRRWAARNPLRPLATLNLM